MNSTTGFQLAHPHVPERIVSVSSGSQVAAAVATARTSDSPLIAVQSTGHGRTRGIHGGTLIDTSGMNEVAVDADSRTVTVGAGATFSAVLAAAARHGLAPLSGSFPGVGVIGYCLNGGIGLLSRKYGFGADNVTELEVVTADGRRRTANATENSELFWALRGAGSNFGIVTSLTMRLFPVADLLAGSISVDLLTCPQALHVWRDWAEAQEPDMMTAATLMSAPADAVDLPPFLRGAHRLQVQLSWSGEPLQGQGAIADLESEFHAKGAEFESTVDRLPFERSGEIFGEPSEPHRYGSEAHFLSRLDGSSLDRVLTASSPDRVLSLTVIGVRRLGGAMSQLPKAPTAIGHRNADWLFSVLSPLESDEASPLRDHERIVAALDGRDREATQILGRALNFTFRDLDSEAIGSAYDPEDLDRLRHLREVWDPERLLMPQFPV